MALISDLVNLRATLNRLAREVPSRIARRGAQGITNQIHRDTSSGLDCYGRPFVPLAVATIRRGRRPPPMVDTGASLDGTSARPLRGAGIAIVLGGAYQHHLRASGTRPAREVLPVRGPMPASWRRRLDAAADNEMKAALR